MCPDTTHAQYTLMHQQCYNVRNENASLLGGNLRFSFVTEFFSKQEFQKIAYKAAERKELLSAINEFLDDSIVLPPGDWERKALLPFRELKAKSEMIRRRKNTRLMEDDETKKGMF